MDEQLDWNGGVADYGLPERDTYYARPSRGGRASLTPRDQLRNKGVDRLFDAATPGLAIDADPQETRTEMPAFSQAIEDALRKCGVAQSPWLNRLAEAWPRIAPDGLAEDVVPGQWDPVRKILFLYVKNSARLFEVQHMHAAALEAAVRAFDPSFTIRQVRVMQKV